VWFLAVFLSSPAITFCQGNFESKASGAWNVKTSWIVVSGTDADTIPDANDNVIIKAGHTITAGNQVRNCSNLTIETGGVLSIDNSGNVRINAAPGFATINGTVTMSNSGTLMETGTGTRGLTIGSGGKLTISGTGAFPAFDSYTLDANSTVEYVGSANQNVQSGIIYGNLTLGGTGTKTVAPLPADTAFRTNGSVIVSSGVTLDVSTNILYARFFGDVQIDGTINSAVGIVTTEMHGAHWVNNGTYLRSTTEGYGQLPAITFYGTQISGTVSPQLLYDVIFEGNCSSLVSLDSLRNVTLRPGSTFTPGSATSIRFTGSWTSIGSFSPGTSTVSCIGTSTQNLTATAFNNLVLNNAAGILLTGDVVIGTSGTLTQTAGSISTGAYTLTVDNPDPASVVPGTNVITGTVRRAIAPGSTTGYTFLGPNAIITPNGIANPASITLKEYPGVFPPNLAPSADTGKIVKRYYTITQAGVGAGYSQAVQLPYLDGEVRGNEVTYALFSNNGSGWVNQGSFMSNPASNFVLQAGLSSFGDWAIAEGDQALPIQLAHFTASVAQNSNNVILNWRTLSETNNYGFGVQRSPGAEGNYADLPGAFIPGHGTTVEPHDYSWTDQSVPQGVYYYRLKQMDLDGTTTYSDGVRIETGSPLTVTQTRPATFALAQNYPNPFNPETSIEFTVDARNYTTVRVHNILGQEVGTLFADMAEAGQTYRVRFDGTGLPNGVYFFALTSGSKSSLRKMTLLK
jgi:hypothetical protein